MVAIHHGPSKPIYHLENGKGYRSSSGRSSYHQAWRGKGNQERLTEAVGYLLRFGL